PFTVTPVAEFDEPWAMTFLPDGQLLVTEKAGRLLLVSQNGEISEPISGLPEVAYGGQGGLGDIVLHPAYSSNGLIYISYAESGDAGKYGAVVARATLSFDQQQGSLENLEVIWRQTPKVTGKGHYGHRLAFDTDGYLFISSGERQKFDPAQDIMANLGKIIRLHDDGTVPDDNPFVEQGGVSAEIWSSGHRNPLGLAFDHQGRLWNAEMGPLHGDELNLVKRAKNYGYPIVSNGDHYSGKKIPNHDTRSEFEAPKVWWKPTIAPAELIFYSGEMFTDWRNSFLIAGLKPKAIIRVVIDGDDAKEVERFDMGARIREIEQGPDGALWILEDGADARLLKLTK
ncbi:MAG: PQQ-dependent sugar dehydrogenase, partial [Arenicella sp.]|nr:PQQ-dependent sugar dehydrogenase [Arenicella sp.]